MTNEIAKDKAIDNATKSNKAKEKEEEGDISPANDVGPSKPIDDQKRKNRFKKSV